MRFCRGINYIHGQKACSWLSSHSFPASSIYNSCLWLWYVSFKLKTANNRWAKQCKYAHGLFVPVCKFFCSQLLRWISYKHFTLITQEVLWLYSAKHRCWLLKASLLETRRNKVYLKFLDIFGKFFKSLNCNNSAISRSTDLRFCMELHINCLIHSNIVLYIHIHSELDIYIPIHSYTFHDIPLGWHTFQYIPLYSYKFHYIPYLVKFI